MHKMPTQDEEQIWKVVAEVEVLIQLELDMVLDPMMSKTFHSPEMKVVVDWA